MKDAKLINLLKTLSEDEMKSFEKFLSSPFFNSVKNHVTLLKELKKFHPGFEDKKLTYEYIYNRLFKGKPFNKQVMWNLISGLEKLACEFLIQNSLSLSQPVKLSLIFSELEKRELDKLFIRELDAMDKLMGSYKINRSYYRYLWVLEEAKISYWQKVKGLQNAFAESVYKSAELSMLEFLMGVYEKNSDIGFYKDSYNIEVKNNAFLRAISGIDFEKIAAECSNIKTLNAGLIEFFCCVILCLNESGSENYFLRVKDFLFKNHELFETDEKRNLVSICENYCQDRIKERKGSYRKQLFELHEFRIRLGILTYDSGRFNKMLYLQMVNNALAIDETQWAVKFIQQFTPSLPKEHQKTMKALANAYVGFMAKKYVDVLENLNKVEFIDTRDKIHVKNLKSRTLYEMKEYEMLLSHIDSSKHFLKNNEQVGEVSKESYSNFYRYLHKIILAKGKNEDLNPVIKKINAEKRLSYKNWLIEKISQPY